MDNLKAGQRVVVRSGAYPAYDGEPGYIKETPADNEGWWVVVATDGRELFLYDNELEAAGSAAQSNN